MIEALIGSLIAAMATSALVFLVELGDEVIAPNTKVLTDFQRDIVEIVEARHDLTKGSEADAVGAWLQSKRQL